ncbi:MAG: ABC transporter permease, partial [Comamonadaceae bacterium]|nr:ABC transporter permease [Comamonadaceae bacterium]
MSESTHRRFFVWVLLAPALLWLLGLVILPHVELLLLSLQAR